VLDADFYIFADKGIDLVIGGSPCTFWSIAKNNREVDKNGIGWKLFMRFVEAVRQIQPRYFLLENVASMPSGIKTYISEELGCEPVLINSALVSAQHRKRLYWTNIMGITQPEDKGILLKDILETGMCVREKSYCIGASYYKGGNHSSPHKQSAKRMMVYEPIALADKSQTILSTMYKENALSMLKRQKTGLFVAHDIAEVGAALRTREDENGRFKRLEVRNDGKMNALTTAQTDTVVCSPVRIGDIGKGGQGNRVYSVQGKTVSIMANGGGRGAKTGLYKIDLPDGDYTIRKLTPIEAERCQTLPDNYTAWGIDDKGNIVKISNTQRYRAIGNGFTADVITHILSHMET
jgi:DNA (cytosine-5)-methyltransferase 3A